MANVVVSFAAADAQRGRIVADALVALGFGVVETGLDQPAPRTLPQIVLWSKASEAPPRLKRSPEAVIVARLDASEPPLFRGAHSVNLQSWRGRSDHRGWRALLSALAAQNAPAAAGAVAVAEPAAKPKDRGAGFMFASAALKVLALAGFAGAAWLAFRP